MAKKGRFDEKYVIFDKEHTKFPIFIIRKNKYKQKEERDLKVCQNCLDGLAFNGFSYRKMNKKDRSRFVAEFTPSQFFRVYPRSLHIAKPKHHSDTAPLNDYPPYFAQLSDRLRQENGWRCEQCGKVLSERHLRQYLHVHHVNGNRSDNSRENLRILCLACHADEPQHSHMRRTSAYAEFARLIR
jgi:HNH endonuclease